MRAGDEEEISIESLILILRNSLKLILLFVVAGGVTGYYLHKKILEFEAVGTLIYNPNQDGSLGDLFGNSKTSGLFGGSDSGFQFYLSSVQSLNFKRRFAAEVSSYLFEIPGSDTLLPDIRDYAAERGVSGSISDEMLRDWLTDYFESELTAKEGEPGVIVFTLSTPNEALSYQLLQKYLAFIADWDLKYSMDRHERSQKYLSDKIAAEQEGVEKLLEKITHARSQGALLMPVGAEVGSAQYQEVRARELQIRRMIRSNDEYVKSLMTGENASDDIQIQAVVGRLKENNAKLQAELAALISEKSEAKNDQIVGITYMSEADALLKKIEVTSEILSSLTVTYVSNEVKMMSNPRSLSILQDAVKETTEESISITAAVLAMALLFGAGVCGVVFSQAFFRPRVLQEVDFRKMGVKSLGEIPKLVFNHDRLLKSQAKATEHGMSMPKGVGTLVSSLLATRLLNYMGSLEKGVMIAVSSPTSDCGKTTVAISLSHALAEKGLKVGLVDGDTVNPQLTILSRHLKREGITDSISTKSVAKSYPIVRSHESSSQLELIPCGTNRSAMTSSSQEDISEAFDKLKSEFDILVVDTGPVLEDFRSTLIHKMADGILHVFRYNHTLVADINMSLQQLDSMSFSKSFGVLNASPGSGSVTASFTSDYIVEKYNKKRVA